MNLFFSRPSHRLVIKRSAFLFASKMATKPNTVQFPVKPYTPQQPNGLFPYSVQDLTPTEPGNDSSFYRVPRFVTHIDENAIGTLQQYYSTVLPKTGTILDFCSSWLSHYPAEIENAAKAGKLNILGTGMNKSELAQNPALLGWWVQDLNKEPKLVIPPEEGEEPPSNDDLERPTLDASTCVVSIDYLTDPIEVLSSLYQLTLPGGKVHLTISNRCFPSKVVGRWLQINEQARLEMVGDYLWWSGWREIEIVTLVQGSWRNDPLWVVRATKMEESMI